MIYKQKVLMEEKIKLGIGFAGVFVPFIVVAVLIFVNEYDRYLILTFLMISLPIFLLLLLVGVKYLEWYCIYDDHIEVRNIYGVKNTVYYCNVAFVEEVRITLTTRGMEKTFYIFNDGRKNNNNILDYNSCYNNKKFNLRIYKTNWLENYIINTLKFKVNGE